MTTPPTFAARCRCSAREAGVILAVSRFRVANGKEQAVVDAFLNRPRLVDAWPGFLGMETFTDVHDATVFYLVTRWTDAESFREWHASPAHRESHQWMPRGLRLDPGYTKVVELDRLTGPAGPELFEMVVDSAKLLTQYLQRTRMACVIRTSLDGAVIYANEGVARYLQSTPLALVGQSIFNCLTEHDAQLLRLALAGEQSPSLLRLNLCDASGSPMTLACVVRVTPVDCTIIGEPEFEQERETHQQLLAVNEELATIARDRHRAAASQQAAREVAEDANRTKDEALAVIAHELRQPLNAATMALAVLQRQPEKSNDVRDLLQRQLSHMGRMVEDLLDASRVLRGDIQLKTAPLDLRDVVRDSLDLVAALAAERRQQLTVHMPAAPLTVSADPTRLRQVFSNLVTNAHKYTPPGGTITVTVALDDGAAVVSVRDTGEGIPAEALGRLFGLFVRATSSAGGLGIGLAMAKRLVELHGGTITAASEGPGRGAEFVVRLPLSGDAPSS
jgi:signal transduction histidine kinase/heme-degrading monooxygenase HmoA